MIPFIVGAAVGAAAGYLLADDGKEKKSGKEDENISHRIVSDEYVRSKMKKLGREIRRG